MVARLRCMERRLEASSIGLGQDRLIKARYERHGGHRAVVSGVVWGEREGVLKVD